MYINNNKNTNIKSSYTYTNCYKLTLIYILLLDNISLTYPEGQLLSKITLIYIFLLDNISLTYSEGQLLSILTGEIAKL